MLRLMLIIAAVAALWWFLFRIKNVPADQQKKMLTKFLLFGAAGLLLLLVATGRAPWFFAIIGAAMPWVQRLVVLKQAWNSFKGSSDKTHSQGKKSTVSSDYLQMQLDHDSGEMDGTIIKGDFSGQLLSELSLEQLQALWTLYSVDPDSQNLLQAYLDFRFPERWREGVSSADNSDLSNSSQDMDRHQALAILGLEETATDKDIITAHKKLMQKLHPDRGGSEYLATKINQAKSVLLP